MTSYFKEIEIEFEFEFDPGQKLIMYPNDRAQEGIEPSVEIQGMYIDGKEVTCDLSREFFEKLETEIMESRQPDEDFRYDQNKSLINGGW